MKKYISLLLIGLSMNFFQLQACDFCGCGSGLINPSILPQFHNNFIGLRFSRLMFYYPAYETLDDMQSLELSFRFYLKPRWQLMGNLPYRFLQRKGSNEDPSLNGLGDANALVQYQLFEVIDTSGWTSHHQLWLGIGLKVPTGNHQRGSFEQLPVHFRLGTGTYDLQALLNYQLQWGELGINLQSSYQTSLTYRDDYLLGDQARNAAVFFTRKSLGGTTLMPSVGMEWEWLGGDIEEGFAVQQSGGSAFFGRLGLDAFVDQLTFGLSYQLPLEQTYGGGEIQSKSRWGISMSYLF